MPTLPVDYTPIAPPTEAYHDRAAATRWRETAFPETARPYPTVRALNLSSGTSWEIGALDAMVGDVLRGISAGAYGKLSLMVTASDGPLVRWLEGVAAVTGVPLFLSGAIGEMPRAVGAPGALTSADTETLDAVASLGGQTTAADFARARGLDQAAANNRLASLEKKRYLSRIGQTRPRGDVFIDPRSAPAMLLETKTATSRSAEVSLPQEIRQAIVRLAADEGRMPEEVLADAWRQYFSTRVDELNENVLRVRDKLRSGETDVLAPEEDPDVDRWAEEAAERLRGG